MVKQLLWESYKRDWICCRFNSNEMNGQSLKIYPHMKHTDTNIHKENREWTCMRRYIPCAKSIELAASIVGSYTHKNKRLIREQRRNQRMEMYENQNDRKRKIYTDTQRLCVCVRPMWPNTFRSFYNTSILGHWPMLLAICMVLFSLSILYLSCCWYIINVHVCECDVMFFSHLLSYTDVLISVDVYCSSQIQSR